MKKMPETLYQTENELKLTVKAQGKEVLVDEDCCTCVNIILKNDGQIMTSFLGAHNPEIVKQLERAQKAYYKEIKKTLKAKYKATEAPCGCSPECTCGEDCKCTPESHCGCGGHCHEEKHDCGCGHDDCKCNDEKHNNCHCDDNKHNKKDCKCGVSDKKHSDHDMCCCNKKGSEEKKTSKASKSNAANKKTTKNTSK